VTRSVEWFYINFDALFISQAVLSLEWWGSVGVAQHGVDGFAEVVG
jgi:hypothetical protein